MYEVVVQVAEFWSGSAKALEPSGGSGCISVPDHQAARCCRSGHTLISLGCEPSPEKGSHQCVEKSLKVGMGSAGCCRAGNQMRHLEPLGRVTVPCSSVVFRGWLS